MLQFLKLIALGCLLIGDVSNARADVTVTNKSSSTIEVKIGNGSKTEIKSGEKAVFNASGSNIKVAVFSSGSEKATSTVRDGKKLKVTHTNGVWSITEE